MNYGDAQSLAQIRSELAEYLRPLRVALLSGKQGPDVPTAVACGYVFKGVRFYKAPGQTGYAWHPYFKAEYLPGEEGRWNPVQGRTIDDIASQIFHRRIARKEDGSCAAGLAPPQIGVK